jgi:hypothetical protein
MILTVSCRIHMKSEILVDQAAACERETRAGPRTALTEITHHLFNGMAPRQDAAKAGHPLRSGYDGWS